MKKFTLLLLFAFLMIGSLQAQDPIFSQFYAAPLQLNPAFAGNTFNPRISMNYRNQYPSFDNAYVTYSLSYEQFLEGANSGIGVMLMNDVQGDGLIKTNSASLVYAYRLQASDDFFIKFGVEGGLHQSRVDWDRLIFLDQINPATGAVDENGNPNPTDEIRPESTSKTYLDISTGLLAYSSKFYGGITLKHLNQPNYTITDVDEDLEGGLPMRTTFHAGALIDFPKASRNAPDAFISPNIMYLRQGNQGQLNAGVYAGYGVLFGGAWYRHSLGNGDAAIFLAGFRKGIFKIGYSYDLTVSDLGAYSDGAHELSLTLNFDESESLKRKRRNSRYNDCFRIFR